ncbi:MAG: hypothetical protein ACKOD0_05495 [Actinomycetota bacterium]
MDRDVERREAVLRAELRSALAEVDAPILHGMAAALERDRDRLIGGGWGVDDGDGCLLTLAARELGADSGEELLRSSVAIVRVPALFDELWASILARSGDAEAARAITHRLVVEALARRDDQPAGPDAAGSEPTALSARPR